MMDILLNTHKIKGNVHINGIEFKIYTDASMGATLASKLFNAIYLAIYTLACILILTLTMNLFLTQSAPINVYT